MWHCEYIIIYSDLSNSIEYIFNDGLVILLGHSGRLCQSNRSCIHSLRDIRTQHRFGLDIGFRNIRNITTICAVKQFIIGQHCIHLLLKNKIIIITMKPKQIIKKQSLDYFNLHRNALFFNSRLNITRVIFRKKCVRYISINRDLDKKNITFLFSKKLVIVE